MKRISQHISYLLLTCRRVEVPGLGCFQANYENAIYDSADGLFYPSRLRIDFISSGDTHSRQNASGGQLLQSIERRLKVNAIEAERLLTDFVKSVNIQLRKQHFCRLEGIGYLIKNKENWILKDTFWKNHKMPFLSPCTL